MKRIAQAMLVLLLSAGLHVQAAIITNGDFAGCDFSGWSLDTDGWGDLSSTADFAIASENGRCRAAINVDYFEVEGDATTPALGQALFANTLYQTLDFSGLTGFFDVLIDVSVST